MKRKRRCNIKLALECPTKALELLQPFADFDWVLGRVYLSDKVYREFYKNTGKLKFIDNSVNEDGVPLSIEELKKVYDDLGGNGWVVSPDWIGDMGKTLEAYVECTKIIGPERVVGVIQGQTLSECLACIANYSKAPGVAVPYDILSKKEDPTWLMGLKRALVVYRIPRDKYIHLLGFTCLDEFSYYVNMELGSIDTGVPVWLGLEGKGIEEALPNKKDPTYKKMEGLEVNSKTWPAVLRNIALLRRYLS